MGKGVDAVDPPGMARICLAGDLFGGEADAADCGQYPDFIAGGGAAIGAQIAVPIAVP